MYEFEKNVSNFRSHNLGVYMNVIPALAIIGIAAIHTFKSIVAAPVEEIAAYTTRHDLAREVGLAPGTTFWSDFRLSLTRMIRYAAIHLGDEFSVFLWR